MSLDCGAALVRYLTGFASFPVMASGAQVPIFADEWVSPNTPRPYITYTLVAAKQGVVLSGASGETSVRLVLNYFADDAGTRQSMRSACWNLLHGLVNKPLTDGTTTVSFGCEDRGFQETVRPPTDGGLGVVYVATQTFFVWYVDALPTHS